MDERFKFEKQRLKPLRKKNKHIKQSFDLSVVKCSLNTMQKIQFYNMQTNTLYGLHMERINDKPKCTVLVPHGWERMGMALMMDAHRASTLAEKVFLERCDECMAATLYYSPSFFWMPGMFHLKPAAVRFAAPRYTSMGE